MRVLQVSAEIYPLLKTGGLADVAGALPAALKQQGCDVRVLLPGFTAILKDLVNPQSIGQIVTPWGTKLDILRGLLKSLNLVAYVIKAAPYYERPGNPYDDQLQQPYADNVYRFASLGLVAAQIAQSYDANWQPRVVHSHDWHAGLSAAYLKQSAAKVTNVFTVHNLAYQGLFAAKHFFDLGLPDSVFSVNGVEFHQQLSFMKAGLFFADRITTVSPTYAQEIQTPHYGCGLDGLLQSRRADLIGILNGVDTQVWNPATDPLIQYQYDVSEITGQLAGKVLCKAHLQERTGLRVTAQAPLFTVVSRLTEQKGLHLVVSQIDDLVARGGQLVVLGSGDASLEKALREQAQRYPLSVAVRLGYDEAFAHQVFAASDVTLVPSRFEPCGLTQLYGLKYGSLPLVRRVGGLADTVVDCTLEDLAEHKATGFVFDRFAEFDFSRAVRRALTLYERPEHWQAVVRNAMQQDFGWQRSAARYLDLYRSTLSAT
jgi:starch synthase